MPTVVDSLIVELGLDPKDFTRSSKEAANAFLKTRDAAVKTGKEIEQAAQKVANNINRMARELIALFGVIAGSRSLSQLIAGLTEANAELGRFSVNMAESPQTLAAWGAAAARVGGSAKSTSDTIQRIGKALYDLRYQGKALPDAFFQLEAATGRLISTDKGPLAFLEQTAAALKELSARDPSRAFNIAQELGIDPGTYQLMKEQGAALGTYVSELEKSVSPSAKAIASAQKLQEAWAKLAQDVGGLVNKLYESAIPAVTALINKMAEWLEANRDWLASEITKVGELVQWLEKIDWNKVADGAHQFASAAGEIAGSVDRATIAVEALLALWAGAKFAQALANMRMLAAGGAAAGGGGLLGMIATLAPWAAALLLSGSTANNSYANASAEDRARMRQKSADDAETYNFYERYRAGARNPRRGYFKGESERGHSLDSFITGTTVDGRPVSRSNPMPVAVQGSGGSGSGGGWLSNLWNWMTGGGSANAATMPNGGRSTTTSAGAGGAAVPNIAGMTDEERNTLGLIMKYESSGQNILNYMGRSQGIDPTTAKGYTAQGYYQILNSNWRRLAPKLGIKAQNAMAASLEDQTKVALALMRESGVGNWSNFNPSLRAAIYRGERAGKWAEGIGAVPSTPALGARGAAQMSAITNDNRRSSNSNVDTRIGSMHIHTNATDGPGIADAMFSSIDNRVRRGSMAAAANSGPM